MIVMTPLNGLGSHLPVNSAQITAVGSQRVRVMQNMAGGARLQISPRGVGGVFATVPRWVWAGGAGLTLGLVGGALYFRKKKRRK